MVKADPERIRDPRYELNLACFLQSKREFEVRYGSRQRDMANDSETGMVLLGRQNRTSTDPGTITIFFCVYYTSD